MTRLSFTAAVLLGLSCLTESIAIKRDTKAPYWQPDAAKLVDGEYLVEFEDSYTLENHFKTIGIDLAEDASSFRELPSLPGYRAKLDDETRELIRDDPNVKIVQHNTYVDMQHPDMEPVGEKRELEEDEAESGKIQRRWTATLQQNAPWNLAQISTDRRLAPARTGDYNYISRVGEGVLAFVMDSGMNLNHAEIRGRAHNIRSTSRPPYCPSWNDWSGHGTHVAGTLAGSTYGVAKYATILNVPVMCSDNSQSQASLVEAVEDIIQTHNGHKGSNGPSWFRGSVINLSVGIGRMQDHGSRFRRALQAARVAGITVVAAAGNDNVDAFQTIPCSFSDVAICVGAVDQNYRKASFSNFGHDVDILAPGVNIYSADSTNPNGVMPLSGTSMATPHVAGVIATFISYERIVDHSDRPLRRLLANRIKGLTSGWPSHPSTTSGFVSNGIFQGHPYGDPYLRSKPRSQVVAAKVDTAKMAQGLTPQSNTTQIASSTMQYNTTLVTATLTRTFEGTNMWHPATPTAWEE